MVSVSTQTPWSWLSDVPVLKDEDVTCGDVTAEEEKSEATSSDPALDTSPCITEELHLPVLAVASHETRDREATDSVTLPKIVSPCSTMRDPGEVISLGDSDRSCGETASLQMDQLYHNQLEFPSVSSSSDDHTSNEDEEDSNICSPPYSHLGTSRQFSWPAILRYLRESESEASKFFSLERGAVNHNRDMGTHYLTGDERREQTRPVVERMSRLCDFCGQPAAQWSMLHATTGAAEPPAEPCCCDFKEYCLLVAACLKQMITESTTAQPAEISVRLKPSVKTTAEENALALMKRRKRWEELQRKRKMKKKSLQSSSFYSLTKQTKTIQFSLVSPAVLSTGWMVGEKQRGGGRGQEGGEGKGKRKGKKKKKGSTFPPDILEMLENSMPLPRALEMVTYHDSIQPCYTLLPDHTGQYFYSSGSLAVLIYTHIPGVLSHLFFDETGDVVCYADELGRAFCYHPNTTSLRLQLSACGDGVLYCPSGEVVRRWRWGGGEVEREGLFQPLCLSLNKQLLLQCTGRDQLLITFSLGQRRVKFTILRKLKEYATEERLGPGDASTQYLSHMQTRIKCLLAGLATMSSNRGRQDRLQTSQRRRSRSTGAIALNRLPSSNIRFV